MKRRKFIRNSSLTAGSLLFGRSRVLPNGPATQFPQHNIPVDKSLDPAWVKALYDRGRPTVYRKSKNELKYIGMPAGGLHAGTVYLGGDGRLWLWGIYNDENEGVDPKTIVWNNGTKDVKVRSRDGANYVQPSIASEKRVLEQGFAAKITHKGKTFVRELNESTFSEIEFEASYPVATVRYIDKALPVNIVVRAGAIFIPLNADDSALPATVFSIEVENKWPESIQVDILGWMENGAARHTAASKDGQRKNVFQPGPAHSSIIGSFEAVENSFAGHRDAGTTCISLIGQPSTVHTNFSYSSISEQSFSLRQDAEATSQPAEKLVGALGSARTIKPGAHARFDYVISWHFDHPLAKKLDRLPETRQGYFYGKRFANAGEVAEYVANNFSRLHSQTLLWQETYYNSSLPHWFLERTLLNVGTLATANTYRFANDRFWGWEGVNACEGTCTHVWQYAQAMGRLFPFLERDARERTDLGIAMKDDGGIIFRAEYESRPAIDGQAGTILRIYREHQMSKDDSFLRKNWGKIKKAVLFMLSQDKNQDGMTDTPLENTLDAVWEGEIAWIVGLCIAAAKAAERMAEEMQDSEFAKTCRSYVDEGSRNMCGKLFNGEYFIHRPDALQGRKKLGSYNTCHIDQVYGQSWAWQVGLGRLWDAEKTRSALKAIWKYNFAPDVGPYIKTHSGGRPYALPGEAGLVMNTNPHNEEYPYGDNVTWQLGYFHECMSGFEHQVASHMMAEGMTDEALVITKAVHDRYHAAKRNPFNEIECSDHYARAMASYGSFITACGYEFHGPQGHLRFAPKWNAENFKAAFTTAEGWGSYSQQYTHDKRTCRLSVKYGRLLLKTFSIVLPKNTAPEKVVATLGHQQFPASFRVTGKDITLQFDKALVIESGEELFIEL